MKNIPTYDEFLNEGEEQNLAKEVAKLIGTGLDPESFYEYLNDYSKADPGDEYGFDDDEINTFRYAFDYVEQDEAPLQLNKSKLKGTKLYKAYLKESVNEVKARRAWSGKIDQLDKLMAWMYDKDIINKGEKNRKDSIFRQYYRYYNDGDFPASLKSKGISKYQNPDTIETALEELIEEYIKAILNKYAGKYDRADFRIDTLLDELHIIKGVVDDYESHGLVTYWSKKTKVSDKFDIMVSQLDKTRQKLDELTADAINGYDFGDMSSWKRPSQNNTIKSRRRMMTDLDNLWTPSMEKEWKNLTKIMDQMGVTIDNVIKAAEKSRKIIKMD